MTTMKKMINILRRPMTTAELEALRCLQTVRFLPASWDKRFIRTLAGATTITENEAPQLWRVLKRYRRQITSPHKATLLALASEHCAPDLRKLQQRIREYNEIQGMKRLQQGIYV